MDDTDAGVVPVLLRSYYAHIYELKRFSAEQLHILAAAVLTDKIGSEAGKGCFLAAITA